MMLQLRSFNLGEDRPGPSVKALAELWPLAAIGVGGMLTLAWCLFLAWTALGLIGVL